MATVVQRRRGTTAQHSTFTGALAELTVDTDKDTVVVHDGSTAGGFPLARENLSNVPSGSVTAAMLANAVVNGQTAVTMDAAADYMLIADGSDSGNKKKALLPDASETAKGIVELATTAEAAAGTDTTRAITPAGLFGGLNASGTAPLYACRAWVNFNGTGTVAIRASGNVTSITDNGTGDYTVNFSTAMPDANYVWMGAAKDSNTSGVTLGGIWQNSNAAQIQTTTALRFYTGYSAGVYDAPYVGVAIFR